MQNNLSPLLPSKKELSLKTNCVITRSRRWKVVWSLSKLHVRQLKQRDGGKTLSEGYSRRSSTGTDKEVQLRWIGIWQNVYLRRKYASQQWWRNSRNRSQHLTACHNQTRSLKMEKLNGSQECCFSEGKLDVCVDDGNKQAFSVETYLPLYSGVKM